MQKKEKSYEQQAAHTLARAIHDGVCSSDDPAYVVTSFLVQFSHSYFYDIERRIDFINDIQLALLGINSVLQNKANDT